MIHKCIEAVRPTLPIKCQIIFATLGYTSYSAHRKNNDARRAPLDCCFSAFKQLFAQGQEFSYGLEELGTYYRDYVRLMAHWDDVLPGKVLRVQHEDVIDDLGSGESYT